MASGPVLWQIMEKKTRPRSLLRLLVSYDVRACMHSFYSSVPSYWRLLYHYFSFPPYLDFSPAPSRPQYTSESLPLTIPCSIPADISWEQIKARGIEKVHWHFFPKPGSTLTSDDPQRLFFLSQEDPMTWKPDQARGLTPVLDPKKKDLSLTRRLGREEDRGDYVCTLKFKNGVTLNRTVHVEVLQSK